MKSTQDTPEHEVFAIAYARRLIPAPSIFYAAPGDPDSNSGPVEMLYYVWVVLGPLGPLVVDCGFTEDVGRRRQREYLGDPFEYVEAHLGVAPSDVRNVVLTHFHYDHTGYARSFSDAKFHVQRAESDFWFSSMAQRPLFNNVVEPGDLHYFEIVDSRARINYVAGTAQVVPGVEVHLVGGHTPGLQVVRVHTARGWVVLASDASHFYANVENDRPYWSICDLPAMYAGFDRLHRLADSSELIVPGHDPDVISRNQHRLVGDRGVKIA